MENVGVAPAPIVKLAVAPGGERQTAVSGFDSQITISNGRLAFDARAVTFIGEADPRLIDAVTKADAADAPAISRIPLPLAVSARATTSGTDVAEAESNSVLIPG